MRQACIILFGILRDEFSVHPSGMSRHRNRVKELFNQHPVSWAGFLELRLWVLLAAGLAADYHEAFWYIDEIRDTMVEMRISEWKEALEVARGILWMEQIFKFRSERLKTLFELSALH